LCAIFENTKEKFKIYLKNPWKTWKRKRKRFLLPPWLLAHWPSWQPFPPRLLLLGPLGLPEPMANARGPPLLLPAPLSW
jgi:hypothetical protein